MIRPLTSPAILCAAAVLVASALPSPAAATIQLTPIYQTIPSVNSAMRVRALDANGDGIPDLVVSGSPNENIALTGSSNSIWWHRGLPGGGYAPATPLVSFPGKVRAWDAGDINNDGKIDFVAVDSTYTAWSVLGNGDGTFQAPRAILTQFWGSCLKLGDLDGDGKLDLVAAAFYGPVYTLKGLGDGRFQVTSTLPPPPTFPVDIAIADFDGDSRPDLMVVDFKDGSAPGALDFFHGLPGGLFAASVVIPMPAIPISVSVGDLDEDGIPDAMVANITGSSGFAALVYGAPVGTPFGRLDLTASGARDLAAIDLDGDGHPELVATESDQYGDRIEAFGRTSPRTYVSVRDYAAGPGPRSLVFTDANGDGRPDIITCDQGLSQLAVLHGHGGFNYGDGEEVRTLPMIGIDVGDVNGDHIPDVVAFQATAGVTAVHLGAGDGTFLPMSSTAGPIWAVQSARLVDVNGDGKLDLVGLMAFYDRLDPYLGDGSGHFAAGTSTSFGSTPHGMAFADFNEDGHPDVAIACDAGVAICLGTSIGVFGAPTMLAGAEEFVAAADFNHDGHVDLIATNSAPNSYTAVNSPISVYLGHGDGTFSALPTFYGGYQPTFFAVGDVNGDGIPDLGIINFGDSSIAIFLGVGDGTFRPGTLFPGVSATSIAFADLDGDGTLDLIATIPGTASVRVWPGLGGGTFGAPSDFGTRSMADVIRVADLNGDGSPDLVIAHTFTNVFDVLLNRSTSYPVATLVSNVEATVRGRHVELVWYSVSSGLYLARVERGSRGAWQDVGPVRSDRADYVTFEEDLPDGEYDYRLALSSDGKIVRAGDVHVSVRISARLGIQACRWDGSARAFSVTVSLADGSPARFQAFDAMGRVVADDGWTPASPGVETRAVGSPATMASGVYWARLRQNGHAVTRRVVVLE